MTLDRLTNWELLLLEERTAARLWDAHDAWLRHRTYLRPDADGRKKRADVRERVYNRIDLALYKRLSAPR